MHAHLLFRDDAYIWNTTYEERFQSWETLVNCLKMRYDNPNRDRIIREEMRNRKQRPNERFSAFLTEMETLAKRMRTKMPEAEKFNIVIENMKMSYKRRLALEPIHSIEHLAQLCYRFDALDSTLYNPRPVIRNPSLNQIDAEDEDIGNEKWTEENEEVCAIRTKMARTTLTQAKQSNTDEEKTPRTTAVTCWNCRRSGHIWRECDKRKTIFCHMCGQADTTAFRCSNNHNVSNFDFCILYLYLTFIGLH